MAGTAAAQTSINSCQEINSPGDFVLSSSITTSQTSCINVTASDVTFDGAGNTIEFTGTSGTAILVNASANRSGVTIENLRTLNGGEGVEVDMSGTGSREVSDLTIRSSQFDSVASHGVHVPDASLTQRLVNVTVADITVTGAGTAGIEIHQDSDNSLISNMSIRDNVLTAEHGFWVEMDEQNGANVSGLHVANNDITATPTSDEGINIDIADDVGFERSTIKENVIDGFDGEGINLEGDDSASRIFFDDVKILNNRITSITEDGMEIDLDDDNLGSGLTLRGNEISDTTGEALDINLGEDIRLFDVNVVDNVVESTDDDGIDVDLMGSAGGTDLEILDNRINDSTSDGLDFDIEGTGFGDATVLVEGNDITNNADVGVHVDDSDIDTRNISVHQNILAGNTNFGVENDNTTVGTFIDATNNFWGASDGPGSSADPDAPFADPVTGTLADGGGSNVSEGGTAGVSNVHFDPFASSPAEFEDEGKECIDRRSLSRGQEGQECPTDREISRGESREGLDRETGRRSDTSRRDRGRRDRSRGR